MKVTKILCLILVCLMLASCSATKPEKSYPGDMENALNALKWQDYETALGESNAFLKRVPHSAPARIIRETAAWQTLALEEKEYIELTNSKLVINSNGFSVTDLPEVEDAQFQLIGYKVTVGRDWEYIHQDFQVARLYLSEITLYWKYPGGWSEYEYILYYPEQLKQADLSMSMHTVYGGDKMSSETHKQFVAFLQDVWVPSMNEVFELLKQRHNFEPEYIGFKMWNQPTEETAPEN